MKAIDRRLKRPDDQQAGGGRQNEAYQRRDCDRKNDAYGPDRQPQDSEQCRKHRPEDQMSILGKRREFLIRQGDGSGQANGHPMRLIKAERLRDIADRVARRGTRLQCTIVHHRLNQQDMPYRAQVGRFLADEERPPGKEGRLPGRSFLERLREGRHRRLDVLQRNVALLETLKYVGQDNQGATQARIGGQPRQEGRCAYEITRRRLHISRRQEEQPLALEESAAVGPSNGLEEILPLLQGSGQTLRGVIGKLGSGAVDDNHGQVVELRKRRFEGDPSLPPVQPFRDQLRGIGSHCEILGSKDQRRQRKAADQE